MNTFIPSRRLHIAQIAPLWESVPPKTYGGIELGIHLLSEELLSRGHEVTIFGSGDSRTRANLQSCCENSLFDEMKMGRAYQYEPYANANLVEALSNSNSFDIIHCHLGCEKIPFSLISPVPMIHTLHTVLSVDEEWILNKYPEVTVVAMSHSQIANIPAERRRTIPIINNGCNFDSYDLKLDQGNYLAFLGRMNPMKSPLDAIRIAKEVNMPLILAGRPQGDGEQKYFSENVQPLIDGKSVTYIGSVNHQQKAKLLRNAAALLFPITWPEPFGWVMIEAMACGTPVVACKNGSVSEVIDFGVTGFYADSANELAELVPRAMSLDRQKVRLQAEQRFSHKKMADQFEILYFSLIDKKPLLQKINNPSC